MKQPPPLPPPAEAALTAVLAMAVLLVGLGSFTLLVTLAVLLRLPSAVGGATTVTVAVEPLGNVPRVQMTVLEGKQLPWLDMAEPMVALLGRMSVTTTLVAVSGPRLLTVMV